MNFFPEFFLKKRDGSVVNPATEETLQGVAGLNIPKYDYASATYPTTSQDVWIFKTGGSGGTTVATVTINYFDSSRVKILNVSKS